MLQQCLFQTKEMRFPSHFKCCGDPTCKMNWRPCWENGPFQPNTSATVLVQSYLDLWYGSSFILLSTAVFTHFCGTHLKNQKKFTKFMDVPFYSTAGHHNARIVVQWEPGEGLGGKAEGSHPTIGHAVHSTRILLQRLMPPATC